MPRIAAALCLAIVLTVAVALTVQAQEDLTPPKIVQVTFEPFNVDTSKSAQTITVTVNATDDLSGVEWIAIQFRKPGTTQAISIDLAPESGWGKRISGDALSGEYQTTMTLRQYSAFGTWEMSSYTLVDNVGNRVDVWKPQTEDEKLRSDDDWPALFNGFAFIVGDASVVAPTRGRLYMPSLIR